MFDDPALACKLAYRFHHCGATLDPHIMCGPTTPAVLQPRCVLLASPPTGSPVTRIAPVPLYNRFEDVYRFVDALKAGL